MHFLGGLLLVIVIFWLATRVAGPKAGVGAALSDPPIGSGPEIVSVDCTRRRIRTN